MCLCSQEAEVEAARKLLRGWWDRAELTAASAEQKAGGIGRRFSIERQLARFKAARFETNSVEMTEGEQAVPMAALA